MPRGWLPHDGRGRWPRVGSNEGTRRDKKGFTRHSHAIDPLRVVEHRFQPFVANVCTNSLDHLPGRQIFAKDILGALSAGGAHHLALRGKRCAKRIELCSSRRGS